MSGRMFSPANSGFRCGRWWRLFTIAFASAVCGGIIPGATLFVQLLVEYGVGKSLCQAHDVAGDGACKAQTVTVASFFSVGMMISFFGAAIGGPVFDRFGSRFCGWTGCCITFVGLLLLQIPLIGSYLGADSITLWVLPAAVVVTDIGAMVNSYVLMGLLWHFPEMRTFVVAVQCATYEAASMLPTCLPVVIKATNTNLSVALLLYAAVVLLSGGMCLLWAPSLQEYRDEAMKALGIPLPKVAKTFNLCKQLRYGMRVFSVNKWQHLMFITSSAVGITFIVVYPTLQILIAKAFVGDKEFADRMPTIYAQTHAVIGTIVAPGAMLVFERCGSNALAWLLVAVVVTSLIQAVTLMEFPTPAGLVLCCCCSTFFDATSNTAFMAYVSNFLLPSNFGAGIAVFTLIYTFLMVLPTGFAFAWIGTAEDDAKLVFQIQALCWISLIANVANVLGLGVMGLPKLPVLLEEDSAELASHFNCQTLEQVAQVTHKTIPELLKVMSSHDPTDFAKLLQGVDYDLMGKILGAEEEPIYDLPVATENKVITPATLVAKPTHAFHAGCGATSLAIKLCGGPGGVLRCCAATSTDYEQVVEDGLGTPLLAGRGATPDPADLMKAQHARDAARVARERTEQERKEARQREVRALNERIWETASAGDGESLVGAYDVEPELLWEAYLDMWEWKTAGEIAAIEKIEAEIVLEEQWKALMDKRPTLKVTMLKMMAYRMQKQWL